MFACRSAGVHMTAGPEAPTRAALGRLVGRAGIDEGHEVSVFLAGDAVQLIRDAVLDALTGLGTGSLRESFDAVATGGGRFYLSGMSSRPAASAKSISGISQPSSLCRSGWCNSPSRRTER